MTATGALPAPPGACPTIGASSADSHLGEPDDHRCASFQHDRSALVASWAMGWRNVCWGRGYPLLEVTIAHTQETLHALFDGVDAEVTRRITVGAFEQLFPHVPPAPPSCVGTRADGTATGSEGG